MSEQSRATAKWCIGSLLFHSYAAGNGDLGSGEAITRIAEAIDAVKAERDQAHEEVTAVLKMIPHPYLVRVCEGGGPENIFASLAVSVLKMVNAPKGDRPESVVKRCRFTDNDLGALCEFSHLPDIRAMAIELLTHRKVGALKSEGGA